jgi:hypothetical protein
MQADFQQDNQALLSKSPAIVQILRGEDAAYSTPSGAGGVGLNAVQNLRG